MIYAALEPQSYSFWTYNLGKSILKLIHSPMTSSVCHFRLRIPQSSSLLTCISMSMMAQSVTTSVTGSIWNLLLSLSGWETTLKGERTKSCFENPGSKPLPVLLKFSRAGQKTAKTIPENIRQIMVANKLPPSIRNPDLTQWSHWGQCLTMRSI